MSACWTRGPERFGSAFGFAGHSAPDELTPNFHEVLDDLKRQPALC